MRKTLLSKTFAVIAALFTLMCMLPQKAMAANYGTVTVDGTQRTIYGYKCTSVYGCDSDKGFCIQLYLTSELTGRDCLYIYGDKNTHVKGYQDTKLNVNETQLSSNTTNWIISYLVNNTEKFRSKGTNTVFTAGYMEIYGDPRSSSGKCGVKIGGGKLTYNGVNWTLAVDFKWERNVPTAGLLSLMGNTTGCSLSLKWGQGTDTQTPNSEMRYLVYYKLSTAETWSYVAIQSNTLSYNLTGLTTGKEYLVEVYAIDMAGNKTSSNRLTVTVKDEEDPKFTPNFKVADITETAFTVSWDKATDSNTNTTQLTYYLWYRESGASEYINYAYGVQTSVRIPNLKPNTKYQFYVEVKDKAGNKTSSGIGTCSTLADTKKPTVPNPQGIIYTVNQTTGKSCAIQWNPATDNATPQNKLQYRVLYGLKSSDSWGYITKWQTATIYTITDLSDGEEYEFLIQVKDEAENTSNYTRTAFTTPDKTAPEVKNNALSLTSTETSITVSWTAATDKVTSASKLTYEVYSGTSSLGLAGSVTGSTTYTIKGLKPNTTYMVDVRVKDEAGNAVWYHPASGTEPTIATKEDKTAPTPPSAKPTVEKDKTSATIKWNAASDNVTAASKLQYQIEYTESGTGWPNGKKTAWFTGTSYKLTGLKDYTSYAYVIRIKDEAGNEKYWSDGSYAFFFTTLDGTAPTVAQNDISHEGSTDSSIKISWKAAEDKVTSASNLVYRIYCNTTTNGLSNCKVGEVKGKTEFTITGLQPDTKYYVDVRVVDEAGNGTWYHPTSGTEPSFRTNVKTAIEGVEMDETTEHDAIYDLRGVKQNQSWDALPKGIYIINGKKHVKK